MRGDLPNALNRRALPRAWGWMLALLLTLPLTAASAAWQHEDGFRSLPLTPAGAGKAGFTRMDARVTAVTFTNVLDGDAYLTNLVAHNGAGVALGDIDGDGLVDLYLCALQGPNRLYRNLGGWRFAEIDAGEAACATQLSTGAALVDVDGDGDRDLLVNGIARGTRLFLNDGQGRFAAQEESGFSTTATAMSLAVADIDGDGDLDVYCTHYIDVMHLADPTTRFALARNGDRWTVLRVNGESASLPRWKGRFEALPDGSVRELPEQDALYRNEGGGRFTPIQSVPGVFVAPDGTAMALPREWGLAVMFRDLTGDGAPDLYVCNDNASPDRVWINSGQGTFRPLDPFHLRHSSRSSMALDMADVNRDGHVDIFVTDMLARDHARRLQQLVRDPPDPRETERTEARPRFNRNVLFLGRSDGSYAETALMAGIAATDWSWCPIFLDVDLDGYEDLLVMNGFDLDVMDQDSHDALRVRLRQMSVADKKRSRQIHPQFRTRNAAFRNRGDGTFEPMDGQWGFDDLGVSQGAATADLDNDGDLDVVVNNLNGAAGLFRNDAPEPRIAVRLRGRPPNTDGIGARVRLTGGAVDQSQEIVSGGRYLSSDQAMRVLAGGTSSNQTLQLTVHWRDGRETVVRGVQGNRLYEIDGAAAVAPATSPKAQGPPLFRAGEEIASHLAGELPFEDTVRQPLLTRRLSRLGPAVAWHDVNGDGWDDLVVTAGRGAVPAIHLNEGGLKFRAVTGGEAAEGDQVAVTGWSDGQGNTRLLVAVANDEMAPGSPSEVLEWSVPPLATPRRHRIATGTPGPLASADVDGDGDLDLFVGGRFLPGRHPEPVSSAVWIQTAGNLGPSAPWSQALTNVGLVQGATFADLDGDGDPDLALATEWGPVRVFRNAGTQWEDMTTPWGFADRRGGWTGITTGDFDGDGRLDLAVGNWGRNTIHALSSSSTVRVYFGDWDEDGTVEVVEAWREGGRWVPVRSRDALAKGLPDLPHRFPTHAGYARADMDAILGPRLAGSRILEINHVDSGVFLNRGSRFEFRPFPLEAQHSPVFGVVVGDFDNDGREDLVLSQNFFGTATDLTREDAGRGLWLRGLGDGEFEAIEASVSGLALDGEQRGAAVADFNHDGRADLVIAQSGAPARLWVNQGARRGLRVTLRGPPGNPAAIGAQLRVQYRDGRRGPCRQVTAGSGYGSQDGVVQVLGLEESPAALWVRWPGGREEVVPLKSEIRDVELRMTP